MSADRVPAPAVRRPRRRVVARGSARGLARGLSLVELMVGALIAMMVVVVAVGVAMQFNASQRQGFAVGAGALNAVTALAAVKDDIGAAGLGFFGESAPLCTKINLSVGATPRFDGDAFAPVRLQRDSQGQDQVEVFFASGVEGGASVLLQTASDGSTASTMSLLPAAVGQAVLLAPATPGTPCTVRSVTQAAAADGDTPQTLTFASSGTHNRVTFSSSTVYAARSRATLLGTLQWRRLRVADGKLLLEQPLDGSSATLLRNVVALRADYGTAAAGTTTLAAWSPATTAEWSALDTAHLGRVRALRIGLVVRSAQREKPDRDGVCRASTTKPVLFGATIEPDVDDWPCWRFRTASVVVPLRNLLWGLAS